MPRQIPLGLASKSGRVKGGVSQPHGNSRQRDRCAFYRVMENRRSAADLLDAQRNTHTAHKGRSEDEAWVGGEARWARSLEWWAVLVCAYTYVCALCSCMLDDDPCVWQFNRLCGPRPCDSITDHRHQCALLPYHGHEAHAFITPSVSSCHPRMRARATIYTRVNDVPRHELTPQSVPL